MGLKGYQPDFTLQAEGKDITAAIRRGLDEIRFTDNGAATKKSDEIEITLSSETLTLPKKGVLLTLGLGFDGQIINKGTFTVCEVSSSGPPRKIVIYATAAPMNAGRHGSDVLAAKTRTFENLTLGDVVATVAGDNGLVARVSASLADIAIQHLIQNGESDAALLTRLAGKYGATSKVTNGFWLFLEYGAAKSAGGKELQSLIVSPGMVSNWSYSEGERGGASISKDKNGDENKGSVIVNYFDDRTGEILSHKTEHSGTDKTYPYTEPDADTASSNAKAKAKRVEKTGRKMDLTMPATPEIVKLTAESRIITNGFGVREDHNWQVESLQFILSESGFVIDASLATDISAAKGSKKGNKAEEKGIDYFG